MTRAAAAAAMPTAMRRLLELLDKPAAQVAEGDEII
jgi:hypothetical protein